MGGEACVLRCIYLFICLLIVFLLFACMLAFYYLKGAVYWAMHQLCSSGPLEVCVCVCVFVGVEGDGGGVVAISV